jgi:hypothetical protein
MLIQELLSTPESDVIDAQRRTPITGYISSGLEPIRTIASSLIEGETNQRLIGRDEYPAAGLNILVIQGGN